MRRTLFLSVFLILFAAGPAAALPAYIVVDMSSGRVISHKDSDTLWYPASVTKLMTAYLTFKAVRTGRLSLTSPVRVSKNANAEPPSKMGYKVGTILNVDNALKMMLVKSANDIAVALAETVGGSETRFVAMMNQEAHRLGMNATHFANPNGLHNGRQYTTARDLAVLGLAVWTEFPEYRLLFKIPAIRAGDKTLKSPNTLLEHYRGTNGMKTGFICASGFNVVATASRRGRTLMVVVLGASSSKDRAETAAKLFDRGFARRPGGQNLATFKNGGPRGNPVDMHAYVCGKNRKEAQNTVLAGSSKSSLDPRFVSMEPIRVYTGRADAAPVWVDIPLPRPRPQYPAGAAAEATQIVQ